MIQAARYARENKVPYFGICLGMQIAVIEYARNAAGITAVSYTHLDVYKRQGLCGQWNSCQGGKQPLGRKAATSAKERRCLETAI